MDKREYLDIIMALRRIMCYVKDDRYNAALNDENIILDILEKYVEEDK